MLKKVAQGSRYVLTELLGAIIYGAVLYFAFTWLAGFSPLHAYFGNLVIMILSIAMEEYSIRLLESGDIPQLFPDQKRRERVIRSLQKTASVDLSFKAMLYLFYILILVFSKIIEYNPGLVGDNLGNFITSNNYSILLLIALDRLIGQVSKDHNRLKKLSAKLTKYLDEDQD